MAFCPVGYVLMCRYKKLLTFTHIVCYNSRVIITNAFFPEAATSTPSSPSFFVLHHFSSFYY